MERKWSDSCIQTCKWLLTSSLVSPSTFISSLICFGVATAKVWSKLSTIWFNSITFTPNKFYQYSIRFQLIQTMSTTKLLKGLQEPPVQLRWPASPGLPLRIFFVFTFTSTTTTATSFCRGTRRGHRSCGLSCPKTFLFLKRMKSATTTIFLNLYNWDFSWWVLNI